MQRSGDQMFLGFEKVWAISHGSQALHLLEKLSSRLDQSTTKYKAKHFAKSGSQRYPDPAFGIFFGDKAMGFIDPNEGVGLLFGLFD